jgi:hypothetical protein
MTNLERQHEYTQRKQVTASEKNANKDLLPNLFTEYSESADELCADWITQKRNSIMIQHQNSCNYITKQGISPWTRHKLRPRENSASSWTIPPAYDTHRLRKLPSAANSIQIKYNFKPKATTHKNTMPTNNALHWATTKNRDGRTSRVYELLPAINYELPNADQCYRHKLRASECQVTIPHAPYPHTKNKR